MRGDLLALKVALAPRVIGYAEMATRPASRPDAHAATNPYRVWIAEYAGAPYQEVAAKARTHPEDLADRYATAARESELIVIFKEATRLEADFWEMGWRADQHFEYSLAAHRVGELANLRRDHLVASVDRRWSVVRRTSLSEVAPSPISTGAPPGELREFERLGEEEPRDDRGNDRGCQERNGRE
jgi:hypothetical protein